MDEQLTFEFAERPTIKGLWITSVLRNCVDYLSWVCM